MSPSSDRIAAPTNGHRSPITDGDIGQDRQESAAETAETAASAPTEGQQPPTPRLVPVGPGRGESPSGGISAGQLAAGFAILVGLIVFLVGRRRGSRG